jgi:hypothetical protein
MIFFFFFEMETIFITHHSSVSAKLPDTKPPTHEEHHPSCMVIAPSGFLQAIAAHACLISIMILYHVLVVHLNSWRMISS